MSDSATNATDINRSGRRPEGPAHARKGGLMQTLKRTISKFSEDNLTDPAAALTYYTQTRTWHVRQGQPPKKGDVMANERQHPARPEQPGDGGFEEGHQRLPHHDHVGQFSDGNETLPDDDHDRVGKFSDGNETLRDDDEREGKFSDSVDPDS